MADKVPTEELLEEGLTPKEVASVCIQEYENIDHNRERTYTDGELSKFRNSLHGNAYNKYQAWEQTYQTMALVREMAKKTILHIQKQIVELQYIMYMEGVTAKVSGPKEPSPEFTDLAKKLRLSKRMVSDVYNKSRTIEGEIDSIKLKLSYYKAHQKFLDTYSEVISVDIYSEELKALDRETEKMIELFNAVSEMLEDFGWSTRDTEKNTSEVTELPKLDTDMADVNPKTLENLKNNLSRILGDDWMEKNPEDVVVNVY